MCRNGGGSGRVELLYIGSGGYPGHLQHHFCQRVFLSCGYCYHVESWALSGVWSNLVFLGNVRADFPLAALVYMKLVNMGICCRVVPCFSLWAKLSCN